MNTTLAAYLNSHLWAVDPPALAHLAAVARDEDAPLAAQNGPTELAGQVAVIPIRGYLSYQPSFFSEIFGGAVVTRIRANLRAAVADPAVRAILLAVDSPGGEVSGIPELAAEIRAARESKPVVAVADTLAASAAYWLASQASAFYVMPSGLVGSIGVFTVHLDMSGMLEQDGVKATIVKAGEYKAEGNPYEPLSDEAKAHLQDRVDEVYQAFVGDVAAGRGVTPAVVRADYGQGRTLSAKPAKAAGMVDAIGTFDDALARAGRLRTPRQTAAAQAADLEIRQRRLTAIGRRA